MPLHYTRSLVSPARTPRANRHLGLGLAFVAGAINAGGFLAVHQYTSHVTGAVSSAADNLALGAWGLALDGLGAVLGARLEGVDARILPATVMLLCFMMGLQNALITKLSQAEIRTTHMTGIVTDIGIELGRMLYWNRDTAQPKVDANRARLGLLVSLLLSFFGGALAGALGFQHAGYLATLPLAGLLCALAIVPAIEDLRRIVQRRQ